MEDGAAKPEWVGQESEVPMIWKKCVLLVQEQTGEDVLGNPVYEDKEVGTVNARFTPWTDEQFALEGREVTKNEQRYLIPVPYKDISVCKKIIMDGRVLTVTQIIDLSPRFTVLQVSTYKG